MFSLLYTFCLHFYLINIQVFDYPDSRLSGLFTEVPTSPDNRGLTVDVKHMTSTTTERTIDELRLIFAEHGLPEQLISDNGPQLTSEKFARFMRQKGNMHTLVPSYHPASSGAAERSVRVVREALEKHVLQGIGRMTKKHGLANFLIKYRSTPHNRELKHRRF